jgi:hypothetical protein
LPFVVGLGTSRCSDARLIRSRQISMATAGETIYYLCLHAIGFEVPFYLARGRGFTPAQIGAFLACQSAARGGRSRQRVAERWLWHATADVAGHCPHGLR